MSASDSGERGATRVLSQRSPVTVGLLIVVVAALFSAGVMAVTVGMWGKGVADDVGSIKTNLTKVVEDHEVRIRDLEHGKKP